MYLPRFKIFQMIQKMTNQRGNQVVQVPFCQEFDRVRHYIILAVASRIAKPNQFETKLFQRLELIPQVSMFS